MRKNACRAYEIRDPKERLDRTARCLCLAGKSSTEDMGICKPGESIPLLHWVLLLSEEDPSKSQLMGSCPWYPYGCIGVRANRVKSLFICGVRLVKTKVLQMRSRNSPRLQAGWITVLKRGNRHPYLDH